MKIWLSENTQSIEGCIYCPTYEKAINEIEYYVTSFIQNRARPVDIKDEREYLTKGIEIIYCNKGNPVVQYMKENQYDKAFNTKFIYID